MLRKNVYSLKIVLEGDSLNCKSKIPKFFYIINTKRDPSFFPNCNVVPLSTAAFAKLYTIMYRLWGKKKFNYEMQNL